MDQPTRIKICGVRSPEIAEVVVEAGADMVGTVFVPRSPRHVTTEQAAAVSSAVAGSVKVVGLFKDGQADAMRQAYESAHLDALQLHGWIDEPLIQAVAPIDLIPAISYDTQVTHVISEWEFVARNHTHIKALLIDAPDPSGIGGGTGSTFNWQQLRDAIDQLQPNLPIVLAGGLTPDNVAEAITTVRPAMVDVSSGVESERGIKDPARIRAFCQAVRSVSPVT